LSEPNPKLFFNALTSLPPTRFIDHKHVQVFRKRDLQEDVKDAQDADAYVLLLSFALDRQRFGDEKADQVRAQLLSAPRVRQEFQRLTSESEKSALLSQRPKTQRANRSNTALAGAASIDHARHHASHYRDHPTDQHGHHRAGDPRSRGAVVS
jgi:hypothetical protein